MPRPASAAGRHCGVEPGPPPSADGPVNDEDDLPHFNIPVTAVNMCSAIGGIACTIDGPLTVAQNPAGVCAVAPGDSGGTALFVLILPDPSIPSSATKR